ncbi:MULTISPECIES: ABC transporter ATP-binding protein [Marinobacter]|uniref:Amino acid/amide ABC transporter ATP-binding protein 1, HAAT family n=1 Tax=Marinobacter segnicrescens TaxID=430453 RepID=A0A1I0DKC6_9GAMM|nr:MULTISPECIES: ABC transporter ATP-binding protein [Marinobacter]UZD65798.1 ABC transporter ATP-binding protein [Marinobacter sp. AN1]SET32522.1 amino acid/amide ABC transporter ATP-binding protein 1, HAAT family [Marinobacter segnicrescens]
MTDPILKISNLTKRFGGNTAVSDINLEIQPQETVAIIGPNGAGKTTFYNMVSGRMTPTEGKIELEGQDITGLPPHKISRMGVSRSFQINNIFPEMTVQENVEVAVTAFHGHSRKLFNFASRNKAVQEEARELLAKLQILELADRRAEVISYGDKRLLEIAVVLATRPHLVLLDEPTAGMTPDETKRTTSLIRQLADTGEYTFLITEHDMDVVFGLADRILVMHRGENLFVGTPDEVKAHPEVRRAYLGEEEEEEASA